MKFLYGLGGANVPVIKEFDIDPATKINAGSAVSITSEGKVTETISGAVLGVCAENHPGKEDMLNKRANGNRVRVDITSGGVYSIKFPEFEAVFGGVENTFSSDSTNLSSIGKGARFVLVKKAADSTNTDKIGTVREAISADFGSNGNFEFVFNDGGTPSKGDVYAYITPVGSSAVVCDGYRLDISGVGSGAKVVGCDEKNRMAHIVFTNKVFA